MNFQTRVPLELHEAIVKEWPDPGERADWVRQMLRDGLQVLELKRRIRV